MCGLREETKKEMTKEELVKKYQRLYKKKTGKDLSYDKAFDQAMKLVTLVKVVYNPVTEEDFERFKTKTPKP